jgi:hypothetical protein
VDSDQGKERTVVENIEIAKILVGEARGGRLEPSAVIHFVNSLQFGGPVPDPKDWLSGIARSMPDEVMAPAVKKQIAAIADRWETLAKKS